MSEDNKSTEPGFTPLVGALKTLFFLLYGLLGVFVLMLVFLLWSPGNGSSGKVVTKPAPSGSSGTAATAAAPDYWLPPDESRIPEGETGDLIRYGRDLVVHTSVYFGPKGTISQINKGMNCQNCHLEAGTKPMGLNFSAVSSTYPKLRYRSMKVIGIIPRVEDCFIRSLNGKPIPEDSKEMKAIVEYIKWLGSDVKKDEYPKGFGYVHLEYTNRAADPVKGKVVFQNKCQSCHGPNGEGVLNASKNEYQYPPLWGENSYNDGAGLYRLTMVAGFVKANMPFGSSINNMALSDTDAWDVAAYISTQPRPKCNTSKDYPELTHKSIDVPFGPYLDPYPAKQHKYGPYKPIDEWWAKNVKVDWMKQ